MKAKKLKYDFCTACNKRHGSLRFHGRVGFKLCSDVYRARWRRMRAATVAQESFAMKRATTPPETVSLRSVPRGIHVVPWRILLDRVGDRDHTGARIVNALVRPDVQAMKVARAILLQRGGQYGRVHFSVFILSFCFLLYWSWPVVSLVSSVLSYEFIDLFDKQVLRKVVRDVLKLYSCLYVRDGALVGSPPGLRACGRDKDRGCSRERINSLLKQLDKWQGCSVELAKLLDARNFKVSDCATVLEQGRIDAFKGADYGSLGFIRCFGLALNKVMIENEQEWRYLRQMSWGIKVRLQKLGLYAYSEAEKCRSCLQSSLSLRQYSLSDLVVFVCLIDKAYV